MKERQGLYGGSAFLVFFEKLLSLRETWGSLLTAFMKIAGEEILQIPQGCLDHVGDGAGVGVQQDQGIDRGVLDAGGAKPLGQCLVDDLQVFVVLLQARQLEIGGLPRFLDKILGQQVHGRGPEKGALRRRQWLVEAGQGL